MPSIKEKCVCQICICGKHHCGEEIKFPSLVEEVSNEQRETKEETVTKHTGDTFETNEDIDSVRQLGLIDLNTTSADCTKLDGQHRRTVTITVEQTSRKANKTIPNSAQLKDSSNRVEGEEKEEHERGADIVNSRQNGMKQMDESNGNPPTNGGGGGGSGGVIEATLNENDGKNGIVNNGSIEPTQRKTWQTSPEQVEELTRSLSRLRTDHEHGGYLYEKMEKTMTRGGKQLKGQKGNRKFVNKSNAAAATAPPSSIQPAASSSQPHENGNEDDQRQRSQHFRTKNVDNRQLNKSFLPPLTGFSDSDSSFGSFSCSMDGDNPTCHHMNDHQVQCICESIKKTRLEERENQSLPDHIDGEQSGGGRRSGINYIDVDDNWIVTRPMRSRPRDNLRLEGPMEMETTFRSTYENTAQRMVEREGSEDSNRSKRSNGSKASQSLYLNTRRGRTNGTTPLLRSARKRRSNRNRPMTSLKTGGDGYYNTISRDAYKNFIIVNGEAKMVSSENVKLPKVITKTIKMASEEGNKHKHKSKSLTCKVIDGKEIRKYEKMSHITRDDGTQELTDMERKIMRKVKCSGRKDSDDDEIETKRTIRIEEGSSVRDKSQERQINDKSTSKKEDEIKSWPIDSNISGAPKRSFQTRYKDNITELGLLDGKSDETVGQGVETNTHRQHTRHLHETSKDFTMNINAQSDEPSRRIRPNRIESEPIADNPNQSQRTNKAKVINGHAVMNASRKPFIIPQRIHRHKNECSINVFEGEMDFVTTNKQVYGQGQSASSMNGNRRSATRVGSGHQRKRTAGRRYLKSGRRRNLFRQSSDSMFNTGQELETNRETNKSNVNSNRTNVDNKTHNGVGQTKNDQSTSSYRKEFDDRLYCPALDVEHSSETFKYTGEAGGHKYYLSTNYS